MSSPVRRSVKKPGESRTRCANTSSRSFATTRSDGAGEQEHLHEVHHALQREREHEADGDAVEQRAVVLLEGGVEQVAHDLRKGEPHGGGDEQAQRRTRPAGRRRAARAAAAPPSGRGRLGRRAATAVAAGRTGVVTSARRAPLAAQPEAQGVERLVHRTSRAACCLEPREQRRWPARRSCAGGAPQSSAVQRRTCTTPLRRARRCSISVSGVPRAGTEQERQLARRRGLPAWSSAPPRPVTRSPGRRPSPRTAARGRAASTCRRAHAGFTNSSARITRTTPSSSHPPSATAATR